MTDLDKDKIEKLIAKYKVRENEHWRHPSEREAYSFAAYDLEELIKPD